MIQFFVELMWLGLAIAIGWYTLAIMAVARNQESPGLGIRMDYVYAGLVIGAAYLALIAVRRLAALFGLIEEDKPEPLGGEHA